MMKSTLFPKPNLKVFLLMALALVAVHEWIFNAASSQDPLPSPLSMTALESPSFSHVEALIQESLAHPTSDIYYVISDAYRRLGKLDLSMLYLRKASLAEEIEFLME